MLCFSIEADKNGHYLFAAEISQHKIDLQVVSFD